ncbi:MAG TPA: DUF6152 family protein [Gammaproteobacteria bacterium]|nr:DUF6152 family protein [Gammaproteobacteria bacterium]
MKRLPIAAISIIGMLMVSGPSRAHHSITANFDQSRAVEIRGRVVDFNYVSPHASMVIDGIAYENGEALSNTVQRWEIESSAVKGLAGRGIMADTFQPGDEIIVRGSPHRRGLNRMNSSDFLEADGSSLDLRTASRGGPVVVPDAEGARRVEGRWTPPFQPAGDRSALPLNEAGLEAWSNYVQNDSPANTCEPMSFPVVMNAPSYFVDIRFGEGQAVIRNEAYDIERTVPLGDTYAPADPEGQWGNVRGRIDGDHLVVESRDYPPSRWGLGAATQINGGGADVPSSERKTLIERFSTSEYGLELHYDYVLFDPAYMSGEHEAHVTLRRVADDAPWSDYNCNVASARQFSRAPGESVLSPED